MQQKRLRRHIEDFHYLYQAIISGTLSNGRLMEIEERDRIFRDIDYRIYASKRVGAELAIRLRQQFIERIGFQEVQKFLEGI